MLLLDWQKTFLRYFKENRSIAAQAPTGIGKGVVAAYIVNNAIKSKKNIKTLIVCPPHLVEDWQIKVKDWNKESKVIDLDFTKLLKLEKEIKEIKKNYKFTKTSYFCKVGKRELKKLKTREDKLKEIQDKFTNKAFIISFNKFIKYKKEIFNLFKDNNNNLLIVDEVHYSKNFKSETFKSFNYIIDLFNYKVLLSATMLTKNSADLFSYIFIANKEFKERVGSWYKYKQNGNFITGTVYLGDGKKHEKIIGITKENLEKDFYPNIFIVSYKSAGIKESEIIHKKLTYKVSNKHIKQMEEITQKLQTNIKEFLKTATALQTKELLNQLSSPYSKTFQLMNAFMYTIDAADKRKAIYYDKEKLNLVKNIVENESLQNKKGLLFFFFEAEEISLRKKFKKAYFYNNNSNKTIQEQIDEFEAGNYNLFIANIASIAAGVRFKNTKYLIEYTLHYDYAKLVQGRGRLRYVQKVIEDGKEIYKSSSFTIYEILPNNFKFIMSLRDNILEKQKQNEEFLKRSK